MTAAPLAPPAAIPQQRSHPAPVGPGQVHNHEWIVREALDSESGLATSWFECGTCRSPYA